MSSPIFSRFAVALVLFCLVGCGPGKTPAPVPTGPPIGTETAPLGRLPADVKPLGYQLDMEIDPSLATFRGTIAIEIELTRTRRTLWLHGNGLTVSDVNLTPSGGAPIAGTYAQVDDGGVAKIDLQQAAGPGKARLAMRFEGPFSKRLNGLYRVVVDGESYAFTQMEPVWTRQAFPCFDEPAFKTPFDVSITAKPSDVVIANTKESGRETLADGRTKVRFAQTEPLPTYLIAFAVGPLEVVNAPAIAPNAARTTPLPFRGIAAKGRGKDLAYAMKHTPALLRILEEYFAVPYPYDKLDIIAVPDKGGAMENAGLITFREWLLLFDENAPIQQKHAFAYVMAHELAHQWFGNLVTMPWWDDIWLNEAFATWMGYRVVQQWRPEYEANMRALAGVHGAMNVDSLLSARQIRQPVTNNDGIHAAFDRITYRKGCGVLGMVERWLGPATFQQGMQRYMKKHAHGSAAADDLLSVLSEVAGRDVSTPFRTFLMQAGLPNVHAEVTCGATNKVTLTQSRYLPLGSAGHPPQRWQVPVCIRFGGNGTKGEQCTLLTEEKMDLSLGDKCPSWVMPNAGSAGYYQWSAPAKSLLALANLGLDDLTTPEQVSLGKAILAAMSAGKIDAGEAAAALRPLAGVRHPDVVRAPMTFVSRIRSFLEGDPLQTKAEALGRAWFLPVHDEVGWDARASDTQAIKLLRGEVVGFLLHVGRYQKARRRAKERGLAYLGAAGSPPNRAVIDANQVGKELASVGEDADAKLFDHVLKQLQSEKDEQMRRNLITTLSHARDPILAHRARKLVLDPVLKLNEAMAPFWPQLGEASTRDATWTWLTANVDTIMARLPPRRAGWLPSVSTAFCSKKKGDEMKTLFEPRISKMPGGRIEIDKAYEQLTICEARKTTQLPSIRKLFDGK